MVLVISTIVLVLSIVSLILSRSRDIDWELSDKLGIGGWVGVVISIWIGFFLLGFAVDVNTVKTEVTDYEIVDSKYHLMIDTEEDVEVIDDVTMFKNFKYSKNFKVYKVVKENSYGLENSVEYVIEPVKE